MEEVITNSVQQMRKQAEELDVRSDHTAHGWGQGSNPLSYARKRDTMLPLYDFCFFRLCFIIYSSNNSIRQGLNLNPNWISLCGFQSVKTQLLSDLSNNSKYNKILYFLNTLTNAETLTL